MIKKISACLFIIVCLSIFNASLLIADEFDEFDTELNLEDIIREEELRVGIVGLDSNLCMLATFIPAFIKSSLWQNTKAPKGRDILYLLPHKITALEYGGGALNFFFNMTNKMHVSAKSLLEFNFDQDLVNAFIDMILKDKFPGGVEVSSSEVIGVLPLLKNMTIQERKGGALLQGGITRGPFTIQLHTSLQFSERNFWLSKKNEIEIKSISNRIFPGQEVNQREFYKLAYGMGDTRLKVGVNTLNLTNLQTDFGFEGILPTSRFSAKNKQFDFPDQGNTLQLLQENGINLLRGVRDYLLNPQFGNGGHFGVGCYFESKIGIFHNLAQLWTRISYDLLFEGDEVRLIMFKKTLEPNELRLLPGKPGITNDELSRALIRFFKENIFPSTFKVSVQPGGIFNFVTSVNVDIKQWRFALGYDFYTQQREQITALQNSQVDFSVLRIEDAEAVRTMQHKIFAEGAWVKKYAHSNFLVGLGGDTTVHSIGLGYDWTLYLKFAASF